MKRWTDQWPLDDLMLYQDESCIIVNKPPGVLTQSDSSGDLNLLDAVCTHLGEDFHLSNRIDRPVSGALLLSKKSRVQDVPFRKYYLAITSPPLERSDRLVHHLIKDGRHKKARVVEKGRGKEAILSYNVVQDLEKYTVLEVSPETGRFHQIRVQLAAIGCPIRGDVKYGARRSNKKRSIDLHAYKIVVKDKSVVAPLFKEYSLWRHVDLPD